MTENQAPTQHDVATPSAPAEDQQVPGALEEQTGAPAGRELAEHDQGAELGEQAAGLDVGSGGEGSDASGASGEPAVGAQLEGTGGQASAADTGAASSGDEDHLEPGQTEVPLGEEVVVDDVTMRRALEAILMVTDEPLPVLTLARAVGRPTSDVTGALGELAEEYTEQGRGFELREVGGGWRYYTRADAAPYVERFVLDGQQARLTQAALETLAVVAYKQPVSRARISAIRGVNVDGVIRTLVARGLVEEAGADTESQATLYRTSSYFLERMGMQSIDDLPELAPYLPDMDDIEEELTAQSTPETVETEPESAGGDQAAPATGQEATDAEPVEPLGGELAGPGEVQEPADAEERVDQEPVDQEPVEQEQVGAGSGQEPVDVRRLDGEWDRE